MRFDDADTLEYLLVNAVLGLCKVTWLQ